ncbi:unnamed protein product, partial [Ectocarpus sp. 6 AP-2014]
EEVASFGQHWLRVAWNCRSCNSLPAVTTGCCVGFSFCHNRHMATYSGIGMMTSIPPPASLISSSLHEPCLCWLGKRRRNKDR